MRLSLFRAVLVITVALTAAIFDVATAASLKTLQDTSSLQEINKSGLCHLAQSQIHTTSEADAELKAQFFSFVKKAFKKVTGAIGGAVRGATNAVFGAPAPAGGAAAAAAPMGCCPACPAAAPAYR